MTQAVTTSTASRVPQVSRSTTFLHALAFVLGFTLVFTVLGSAAAFVGQELNRYQEVIQRLGAVLLVIFGLVTLGVFKWIVGQIRARADLAANPALAALVDVLDFFNTLLYTERRVADMRQIRRGWGYLSSALMGMSFSAGWVPCIGPILASILFLAQDRSTVGEGAVLLLIYSLGLGIPFLLTGLAFGSATRFLRRLNRRANIVSIVSGIFLLYVAWLLWSDQLATLTTQFYFLNEWVFGLEEWISSTFGVSASFNAGLLASAPLAFVAGLISFISPCVLPLIPAYIGYLSGASLASSR